MARLNQYGSSESNRGGGSGGDEGSNYGINWGAAIGLGAAVVGLLVFFGFLFVWFGCRIEPKSGQCAVLFAKSGDDIPANEIVAMKEGQKGIQLETLSEGRYFRNPLFWGWEYVPLVHIAENQVGILTRRFGDKPPVGQYIVSEKPINGRYQRGVVDQPLRPGTYRINPYAYECKVWSAVTINPGEVGVVTLRYGNEPSNPNGILAKDGERGVQPHPLRPGTYYLNPYIQRVDTIGVQSHKTDLEISFLSKDGFRFPVRGAVEWAIDEPSAPEVFVLIGDADDIVQKVILRSALSMSRIQGSKYTSADVISGTVRKAFQDEFSRHITLESAKKKIGVKAALISEIEPPQKVSNPIRERQIAVQTSGKYDQEIKRAVSDAQVAQQTKMQDQKTRVVSADTLKKNAIQKSTKDQEVSVIAAQRDLDVAKKGLEAAEKQAQAIVYKGQGDADVVRYMKLAEASALRATISPFGDGMAYARYLFLSRMAPNINSIVSSTDSPLAGPFKTLSNLDKTTK